MRFEHKEFTPPGLDLFKAEIKGFFDSYRCTKKIGGGSQGDTYRILSEQTGREGVFKWNHFGQEESSTQYEPAPYWSFLLESDILEQLTLGHRVAVFTHQLQELGALYFRNGSPIIDGVKVNHNRYFSMAASYHDVERLLSFPGRAHPIIIDQTQAIIDGETGKSYYPLLEPKGDGGCAHSVLMGPEAGIRSLHSITSFENGSTLEEMLATRERIGNGEELVRQLVLSAMTLHAYGVLHRDIKPQNIIVAPNGTVRLLDFGVGQFFNPSDRVAEHAGLEELPVPGQEVGKGYIRPISSSWFGARLFTPGEAYAVTKNKSDIYAVGLNAALILTGEHPYLKPRSYAVYVALPDDERKRVRREHKERLVKSVQDGSVQAGLVREYHDFLQRHDNTLLHHIAPAFHPDPAMRPNRMSLLGKSLGLDYAVRFPYYADLELDPGSRPIDAGYEPFYEALKGRKDFCFFPFLEYGEHYLSAAGLFREPAHYITSIRDIAALQKRQEEDS